MFVRPQNSTDFKREVRGQCHRNEHGFSATTSFAPQKKLSYRRRTLDNPYPSGCSSVVGSSPVPATTSVARSPIRPVIRDPYALAMGISASVCTVAKSIIGVTTSEGPGCPPADRQHTDQLLPSSSQQAAKSGQRPRVELHATSKILRGLLPGLQYQGATVRACPVVIDLSAVHGITEQNVSEGGSVYHDLSFRVRKAFEACASHTGNTVLQTHRVDAVLNRETPSGQNRLSLR